MEKILKSKRSQGGVFGLSFGTIWGIILIVFFVVGAFFGINAFLDYQKCASIGLFFNELQSDVSRAWNSQSSSFRFNSTLPAGSEYVCFINVTAPIKGANNIETQLYSEITNAGWTSGQNTYIYAPTKDFCMNWGNIKHINISQHNPICVKVIKNIASIKIEKKFEENLVRLSE